MSPNRVSLPRFHVRIGLHIVLFEVCSAFTRVAACTLARSPYVVTAIRRLQTLRLLHACSGRFRLERSPGGACTHWKSAALSRRTRKADDHDQPHGAADAGDPSPAARPNCSTLRSPATRTCTSVILYESCRHRGRAYRVAGLEGPDRCLREGIRRYFQAVLAHELRRPGVRIGYDADEQAVVVSRSPSTTVRRSARRAGRSSTRRRPTPKTRASTGRLGGRRQDGHPAGRRCRARPGKMKPQERNIWREQAAALGWHHRTAMEGVVHEPLSDGERFAPRDDQGERPYCRTRECSRTIEHCLTKSARCLIALGPS